MYPKIDMKKITISIISFIIYAIAISDRIQTSSAETERYWSILTGEMVVPPIDTDAHGILNLKFDDEFEKLVYYIGVFNIDNVTRANIYHGSAGQNGEIVLDLLNNVKTPIKEHLEEGDRLLIKNDAWHGSLIFGGVTANNLQGPLTDKSLSELDRLLNNGSAYVSLHTTKYPQGEVRGDFFIKTSRVFPDLKDFDWN